MNELCKEGEMKTGSNNITRYFEDGDEVYPCRCGKTHKGDYAKEDWIQHNCFHEGSLILVAPYQAICGICGESFMVEEATNEQRTSGS